MNLIYARIRRLCIASPLLAIGILATVLILFAPVLSDSVEPIHLLPSSWRETRPYKYPPTTSEPIADEEDDESDSDYSSASGSEFGSGSGSTETDIEIDIQPLDQRYAPYFPSLALPSILLDTPSLRPLAGRLSEFLSREGFDKEEWTAQNEAECPRNLGDGLVNPDQYNGEIDFWEDISAEDIAKRRADIVQWLATRAEGGEDVVASSRTGKGKGIVLTGGNQVRTLPVSL